MAPIVKLDHPTASGDAWNWQHSVPPLSTKMIHVWRAELHQPDSVVQEMCKWLTPDEIDHAERFRFRHLTNHFIVRRGILRVILAQYLGIHPGNLRFNYTRYGKPLLAANSENPSLQFNLSHAGNLALFAITRDRPVGIDIEVLRSDVKFEQLAKLFFSPHELKVLSSLSPQMCVEVFFRCWVRKEAYVKGLGKGLSLPLNTFSVSIKSDTAKLQMITDPGESLRWSLCDVKPGEGYMAALAAPGRNWQPTYFDWLRERADR